MFSLLLTLLFTLLGLGLLLLGVPVAFYLLLARRDASPLRIWGMALLGVFLLLLAPHLVTLLPFLPVLLVVIYAVVRRSHRPRA